MQDFGQVDFSSRLEMICNETNGARKFRQWRYYRLTDRLSIHCTTFMGLWWRLEAVY